MNKPSQNSLCPCGSGKKYKRCCGAGRKTPPPKAQGKERLRRLLDGAIQGLQSSDWARAAECLAQARALAPSDPGVLGLQGMLAHHHGNGQEAEQYLHQAIALSPLDSRLYNFLGQILEAADSGASAERAFGKAVTLDPGFVEAWCNLGVVQLKQHRHDEATLSFEQALLRAPADGEFYLYLAHARFLARDAEKALGALQKAETLGVHPRRLNLWRSMILRDQGRIEAAQAIEDAVLSSPDAGQAFRLLLEFGKLALLVGNLTAAEHWLAGAIALDPAQPGPYMELAHVRKFTAADEQLIGKMLALLESAPEKARRGLEFALGKVYTDVGDYDRSFEHYQAANTLVRQSVPFDAAEYIARVTRIIDFFTPERLASLPRGSDSNAPVLIVGTPRSGTTLTEQIISSHSQVAGVGEMVFWPRIALSLLDEYSEQRARVAADGYLALMRQNAGTAPRITDKMPGNFMHLGIIHAVFPNAKIIHCQRHPIDACLSIYFQNFPDGHEYKWDMDSLVVFYEQYQRLMDHWRTVLPEGVMYESRYEDLVDDVETHSRRLMEFLGLEWELGQLGFYKQDRAVFTASKWQARQPIYKTSKERWRRYEQFIGPLLPLLKYAQNS
jgi:tetratricopeptide (TPR) repeat protein